MYELKTKENDGSVIEFIEFIENVEMLKILKNVKIASGDVKRNDLLKDFGKHTTGKSCVYINKVADIRDMITWNLEPDTYYTC